MWIKLLSQGHSRLVWCPQTVFLMNQTSTEPPITWPFLDLFQPCEYCRRLGATIQCHAEGCLRFYHFPCSAASGSFQSMKQLVLLCPEHIDKAEELGKETLIDWLLCSLYLKIKIQICNNILFFYVF